MTREEAIKCLEICKKYIDKIRASEGVEVSKELCMALDMAIEALSQEPCDDAVSKQAVLDALDNHKYSNEFCEEHHIDWSINLGMAHIVINELPPVTPKHKQGEWCEQNDDYFDWYECSECGYGSEGEMQYSSEHDVRTKYCPNCGAEMR